MELVEVFSISPVNAAMNSRPDGIPGLSSVSLHDQSTKNAYCRTIFSPGPSTVQSPVTNLTFDLNNLAGLGSQCDTPKRTKHDFEKVPSFASDVSSDAGLGMDFPSPMDPVEIEDVFEKAIQQSSRIVNEKVPFRRISSLPLQLLGVSPSLKGQEVHCHRYGIFGQEPSISKLAFSLDGDNKENLPEGGFEFKKPTNPVSRCHTRSFNNGQSKEAFACRPSSAPALMLSSSVPVQQLDSHDSSPLFLSCSSLTSSLNNDDDDDGFLDIVGDNLENDTEMPQGMASLLTAPLVGRSKEDNAPVIRCRPRNLFRSPSVPSPVSRSCAKRPDCPRDDNTPIRVKRRRSLAGTEVGSLEQEPELPQKGYSMLHRSKSFSQTEIEKLLDNKDGSNFSKPFILPTVEGRHQELKYITSDIMVAALNGQFSNLVERVILIDCRYPYEFEGGHVKCALNLHQEDQVEDFLIKNPIIPTCPGKRVVIIFHCEFSSERGPRMCRFVRERDRAINDYPRLCYPELYILKGGYKEFFPHYQSHCEPPSYRPMNHKDFKEDLRKFRLKSRTWAGERSKRDMYSRLKKL
ncbi:M-phase inducer phosphatase 2 isoform X2 [Thalassophryne amazonica]|uniref:M-phase inducer phosphatase 2 isoform X2 n=1 Tax=Thalassophryne amazonica TaxID=390379 RepID=UPI001472581B|nr:M-phase inducer phosphatase 2 isoform X2 [Thalassophryne amazonica]